MTIRYREPLTDVRDIASHLRTESRLHGRPIVLDEWWTNRAMADFEVDRGRARALVMAAIG